MENVTVAELVQELGVSRQTLKAFINTHEIPVIRTRIKDTRGPRQITLPPESAALLRTLYTNRRNKVQPNTYTYGKVAIKRGQKKLVSGPRTRTCPTCDNEFTITRVGRIYRKSRKAPVFRHGDIRLHAFPKA